LGVEGREKKKKIMVNSLVSNAEGENAKKTQGATFRTQGCGEWGGGMGWAKRENCRSELWKGRWDYAVGEV